MAQAELANKAGKIDVSGAKVDVPFGFLLALVEGRAEREAGRRTGFSVVRAVFEMEARALNVYIRAAIEVVADGQCEVPLSSDAVALVSSKISSTSTSTSATTSSASSLPRVCASAGQLKLLVWEPSTLTVSLEFMAPYASSRNGGIVVPVPVSAVTEVTFTHPDPIAVTISNSVEFESRYAEGSGTRVKASLSPSPLLNLQWVDDGGEDHAVAAASKSSFTVSQSSVFSIGEGLVNGWHSFDLKIVSGSLSGVEIALSDSEGTSVVGVQGEAIKRWEVVSGVLKVVLDKAVEESYELVVRTEKGMAAEGSGEVEVCSFAVEGATRDVGHIGVAARTSVELSQVAVSGLSAIDVSELPAKLKRQSPHPLLLAFKFLNPENSLTLRVTRHSDVEVLIAVVTELQATVIVTAEGRVVHRVRLLVKNSSKQYLRVTLPPEASIWSTTVSHSPVKPARSAAGEVLVPLKKTSSVEQEPFTVELVYVLDLEAAPERTPVGSRGKIAVSVPAIDLPVDIMFLTVALPSDSFKYGEFQGDCKEVVCFSRQPVQQERFQAPQQQPAMAYGGAPSQTMKPTRERRSERLDEDGSSTTASFLSSGVLPVAIEVTPTGRQFLFEQRLVVNQARTVHVPYKRVDSGDRKKRSIDWSVRDLFKGKPALVAALAIAAAALRIKGIL